MSDPTPSNPKMEGNSKVVHDNLSDADHKAELHCGSQEEYGDNQKEDEE
jgi:hypothetical protein